MTLDIIFSILSECVGEMIMPSEGNVELCLAPFRGLERTNPYNLLVPWV